MPRLPRHSLLPPNRYKLRVVAAGLPLALDVAIVDGQDLLGACLALLCRNVGAEAASNELAGKAGEGERAGADGIVLAERYNVVHRGHVHQEGSTSRDVD